VLFISGERYHDFDLQRFTHMAEIDFQKKYLGLLPPSDSGSSRKRAALSAAQCKDVPESLNWNTLGKVSKVKTQKECGSCYIFSGTGVVESAAAIEYGIDPPSLSRQHILDCVQDPKGDEVNGCNPGRPEWIWMLSKKESGLVEDGNEYTGAPGMCNKDAPKAFYTKVESWKK
jgi:C1A family cysteine protease